MLSKDAYSDTFVTGACKTVQSWLQIGIVSLVTNVWCDVNFTLPILLRLKTLQSRLCFDEHIHYTDTSEPISMEVTLLAALLTIHLTAVVSTGELLKITPLILGYFSIIISDK
ncbi:unnamed protein product [Anisakis simplex]|uniref:Secreted protein n=1 Tax=Anisakis simplex TaxID=6269 RepID=A0A0M3IZ00_ANISI|nr:unnamed protein product [Anisakis simplex]